MMLNEKTINELLENIDNDENYDKLMNFINKRRVELKTEFVRLIEKFNEREQ